MLVGSESGQTMEYLVVTVVETLSRSPCWWVLVWIDLICTVEVWMLLDTVGGATWARVDSDSDSVTW